MQNTFTAALIASQVVLAAEDGLNVGGIGTGRDAAQVYNLFGDNGSQVVMRLHLYEEDEVLHVDATLSAVGINDQKWWDYGFCFRPVDATQVLSYDCLGIRFNYDHANLETEGEFGH